MKCSGCLKDEKDLVLIKCTSANCKKYFCTLCSNIPTEYDKKKTWKCPDCSASTRRGGDNSSTPVRGSSDSQNITNRKKQDSTSSETNSDSRKATNPEKQDPPSVSNSDSQKVTTRKRQDPISGPNASEVKELITEVRLLTQEISSMKQRLEEATNSLTRCHVRLDELATAVSTNESRIQVIEDREKEVINLKTTVELLQRDLNSQAQAHLRNEVEISGIPEIQNENPYHIVLLAARKIGVELVDCDIDWVTRVGPRTPAALENETRAPRPLVARFMRRSKRDLLLKASKSRKNVMSNELEIQGPPRKVYFNERLTKENRMLFREARNRAKLHGYAFCWCNQGSIYVRQREGKAAMHVSSLGNLDNILSA